MLDFAGEPQDTGLYWRCIRVVAELDLIVIETQLLVKYTIMQIPKQNLSDHIAFMIGVDWNPTMHAMQTCLAVIPGEDMY